MELESAPRSAILAGRVEFYKVKSGNPNDLKGVPVTGKIHKAHPVDEVLDASSPIERHSYVYRYLQIGVVYVKSTPFTHTPIQDKKQWTFAN